ncbi:hypothetical protein HYY69_06935 [Candidatus Woesearchaeota archaeon]|nr:hypothetical protein [Candidatus Woesearchaeota archaeon]
MGDSLYCPEGRKGWKAIVFFSVVMLFITLAPLASKDSFKGMMGITSGTTYDLAPLNATVVNSLLTFVYLSIVLVMPVFLVGFGGYLIMKRRTHPQPELVLQKLDDVPYSSLDHQFHLFPHVEHFKKQKTSHGESVVFKTNNDYENAALHPYLKDKLLRGHTTEELHTDLSKYGWDKETINIAVRDLDLTQHEIEIVLSSYIMRCLGEGNSLNTIKDALYTKGWHKETVDTVLQRVDDYVLAEYKVL